MKNTVRKPHLLVVIPTILLLFTIGLGAINYEVARYTLSLRATEIGREIADVLGLYIFISSLIITIFALLIGIGLAYGIIKPLRRLSQAATAISRGQLQEQCPLTDSPYEIGQLGQSFNCLIDYLKLLFQERDKLLVNGLNGSLILTDSTGHIQAMNIRAERLFGVKMADCLGQTVDCLYEAFEPKDKLQQIFYSFLQGETAEPAKIVINGPEQRRQHISISYSILRDKGGHPLGYLFNVRDLSPMGQLIGNIHYVDQLAALGAISAGLAHEIRNPLSTIQGMVQMLKDEPDSVRKNQYLARADSEIKRINYLVTSIGEFSEVNAEPSKYCDINEILAEALELCQNTLTKKTNNINIITNYAELPQVKLPPHKVVQAFRNLIANAIEFSPDDSYVRISSYSSPSANPGMHVEIANSGSYIPENERDKIFEPFFTTKAQGTGLGLPIAYQIISYCGGTISVDCNGQETRFIVEIPYATRPDTEPAKSFT